MKPAGRKGREDYLPFPVLASGRVAAMSRTRTIPLRLPLPLPLHIPACVRVCMCVVVVVVGEVRRRVR